MRKDRYIPQLRSHYCLLSMYVSEQNGGSKGKLDMFVQQVNSWKQIHWQMGLFPLIFNGLTFIDDPCLNELFHRSLKNGDFSNFINPPIYIN